jgi:NADPH:quinone reductase-like Zn-dependent oxidoreductase
MKAFFIRAYGNADQLVAGDLPEPVMHDDDVLVRIHAAGVNPVDSKIRSGEFKLMLPYRMPLVLGSDLAGVVERVGAKVSRFKAGDEVYARAETGRNGSFAELIAVKETALARKPAKLTMEQAASIPLVALTAWQTLVDKGQLKQGQKVLIHAGSGGVGTIAIQLAKHIGATVATTASAANTAMLKDLGADIVIDYKTEDFSTRLSGYDLVLDTQGGDTLRKSLSVLKPGGKLIGIAGPPDPAFARELGANGFLRLVMWLLSYRIRRAATRTGSRYAFHFMTANGQQLGEITGLIEAGKIVPVIDRVFPFEQTRQALDYVDSGRVKGKVVIKVL